MDRSRNGDEDWVGSDTESSVGPGGKRMSVIELWRRRETKALKRQSAMSNSHTKPTPTKARSFSKRNAEETARNAGHAISNHGLSLDATRTSADPPDHDSPSSDASGTSIGRQSLEYQNEDQQHDRTLHTPSPVSHQPSSLLSPHLYARRSPAVTPLETDLPLNERTEMEGEREKQTIMVQSPKTLKKQEARNRRANILNVWTQREGAVSSPSQTTRRSPASVTSAFFEEMHAPGSPGKASDQCESPIPPLHHHHHDRVGPVSPQRRSLSVLDRWKKGMVHTDDFSSSQENSPMRKESKLDVDDTPFDEVADRTASQDSTVTTTRDSSPTSEKVPAQDTSQETIVSSSKTCGESRVLSTNSNSTPNVQIESGVGRVHVLDESFEAAKDTEEKASMDNENSLNKPHTQESTAEVSTPSKNATIVVDQRSARPASLRRNLESSFASMEVTKSTSSSTKNATVLEASACNPSRAKVVRGRASGKEESKPNNWSTALPPSKTATRIEDDRLPTKLQHRATPDVMRDTKTGASESEPQPAPTCSSKPKNVAARWTNRNRAQTIEHPRPSVSPRGEAKTRAEKREASVAESVGNEPTEASESKITTAQQPVEQAGKLRKSGLANSSPDGQASHEAPLLDHSLRLDYSQESVLSSRSDLSPAPTCPSMPGLASSDSHSLKAHSLYRSRSDQVDRADSKAALYVAEAMKLTLSCARSGANKTSSKRVATTQNSSSSSQGSKLHQEKNLSQARKVDFERFRSIVNSTSGNKKLALSSSNGSLDSSALPLSAFEAPQKTDHYSRVKSYFQGAQNAQPSPELEPSFTTSTLANSSYTHPDATISRVQLQSGMPSGRAADARTKQEIHNQALKSSPEEKCSTGSDLEPKVPCEQNRGDKKHGQRVSNRNSSTLGVLNRSGLPSEAKGDVESCTNLNPSAEENSHCSGLPPPATTVKEVEEGSEDCKSAVRESLAGEEEDNQDISIGSSRASSRQAYYMKRSKLRAHRRLVEKNSSSRSVTPVSGNVQVGDQVAGHNNSVAPASARGRPGKREGRHHGSFSLRLKSGQTQSESEPSTAAKLTSMNDRGGRKGASSTAPGPTEAHLKKKSKSHSMGQNNSISRTAISAAPNQHEKTSVGTCGPGAQKEQRSESGNSSSISSSTVLASAAPPGRNDTSKLGDDGCSRSVTPISGTALKKTVARGVQKNEKRDPARCEESLKTENGRSPRQPRSGERATTSIANDMSSIAAGAERMESQIHGTACCTATCAMQPQNGTCVSEAGHSDSLSFFSHAGSAFSGYSGRSSFISQAYTQPPSNDKQLTSSPRHGANLPPPVPQSGYRTGLASRYDTPSRFLEGEIEASCSAGAEHSTVSSAAQSSAANSTCESASSRSFASDSSDVYTTLDESYNSTRGRRGKRKSSKGKGALKDGLSQAFQDAFENVAGSVMAIDLRQLTSGLNIGVQKASESWRKMVEHQQKHCEENACSPRRNTVSKNRTDESTVDEGIAIEVEYVSDSEDEDSEEFIVPPSASKHILDQELMAMAQTARKNGAFLPPAGVWSQDDAILQRSTTSSSLLYMGQIRLGTTGTGTASGEDDAVLNFSMTNSK